MHDNKRQSLVASITETRRTFPARLILFRRLSRPRRGCGLLVQERGQRLSVGAYSAWDTDRTVRERGKVDAHEPQYHVVRHMRHVVARHV